MKKINLSADRYLPLRACDLAPGQIIIGPFGDRSSSNAPDFMYMRMAFIKQFFDADFTAQLRQVGVAGGRVRPPQVQVFWSESEGSTRVFAIKIDI